MVSRLLWPARLAGERCKHRADWDVRQHLLLPSDCRDSEGESAPNDISLNSGPTAADCAPVAAALTGRRD